MRVRALAASMAVLSVAACSDNVTQPDADPLNSGPSFAIYDSGTEGSEVDGFWFLPPLAKQVTTEGVLDEGFQPSMEVCQLDRNPSLLDPNTDPNLPPEDAACVPGLDPVVTFPAGSATINPGESYQFSWSTDESQMSKEEYYRVHILLGDSILGYLDVNPQAPAGETPGEDFDDLYAFRLGETLPVKFFLNVTARCALADEQYVVQCIAQGVIDGNGGVVTLDPIAGYPTTLSTVVPAGALPPGYPQVILTMERIDPDQFLIDEGEECIPGLGIAGFPGFDAPQFGDCLRVSTDPVLPVELEFAALIEICTPFNPLDYPTIKFLEEQDTRLQIIRYDEVSETQGLPNVDATTCSPPAPSPQFGFFPVPREDGFTRTAALTANTVLQWLGPEPLAAHGDIRLAGATTEFSRFRWGLPGQMVKTLGDNVIIQQQEDGSESYDVTVQVRVDDAGSPDLSLSPSTIEGATVHFSGAASVAPADVTTLADGIAATTWTVPSAPGGPYTMDATALGLLAGPVPVHTDLIDFNQETVTFTATVVGLPDGATASPPEGTVLEGLPGETLDVLFTITVVDVNGEPVVGYPVTWSTFCSADPALCDGYVGSEPDGSGEYTETNPALTDENGQASGYWTLATVPGSNTLVVTVGSTSLNFTAATWTATGGCQVTVDGNPATVPGEWDCALDAGDVETFEANLSGGNAPAEVRWQTDADNIYFLVLIEQAQLDKVNSLRIDFDNTGNGASADDDAIGYDNKTGAFDEYLTSQCVNRSQSGCGSADSDGQTDVVIGGGGPQNNGVYTIYEFSHPLNGTAGEDIRVADLLPGEDVGFYLTLSIGNGAQGNTQIPGFRVYRQMGLN